MSIATETVQDHPGTFTHTYALPGSQALAVVGRLARGASQPEVDALLYDAVLTEGYDAEAVLALANAALAVEDLGTVDSIALFSAPDVPAADEVHVSAAGDPAPMILLPDATTSPARRSVALRAGAAVLLGSRRALVRVTVS